MNQTEAVETPSASDDVGTSGVIEQIGALPAGAVIFKRGLQEIFGCCDKTIDRAVYNGELPVPAKLRGKPVWTAGSIVRHIEKRMAEAAENAAKNSENI